MPAPGERNGGDTDKGTDEEVFLSKELWRQHERERGAACMEYLATRFAGFDGAAALQHILPWLLNVSITHTSPSSASSRPSSLAQDRHCDDDGGGFDCKFAEAARLEALSALVAASSNAQRKAYMPVLLPRMAVALAHEMVPFSLREIRFLSLFLSRLDSFLSSCHACFYFHFLEIRFLALFLSCLSLLSLY